MLFDAVMSSLLLFLNQRAAYLREITNKTYTIGPYFLSVLLIELPFELLNPIVFSCIIYFGVGLEESGDKFFTFMGVLVLQTFAGS